MADYIYMLESRLSPEQQRALAMVQQAALAHGTNLYLTGGAIRDIVTGFAMVLTSNPGCRGQLLDTANSAADVEATLIRILHNYSFFEEPSRLIRANRFLASFHGWTMEERTKARYDSAVEGGYIDKISKH